MGEGLRIKDDVLRRGHASLVAAKSDFDLVQDRANDAADACGHGPLAQVLRESSSDWALRRGKLSAALENLAGHMKAAIDGFEKWETEATGALQGDGSTQAAQPAPAPNAVTQQGGSGPMAGAPAQPAAPPAMPPSATGPAAAGAAPTPQPGAPAEPGRTPTVEPVVRPGPALADLVAGLPDVSPPGLVGVPVSVGAGVSGYTDSVPHRNLRLDDAQLDDLLGELVQRWQSLGGQEKAVIAALAGAGLLGLASTVSHSGAKAGGHRAAADRMAGPEGPGGSPQSGVGASPTAAPQSPEQAPSTTTAGEPSGAEPQADAQVLDGPDEGAELRSPGAAGAATVPPPPPALADPGDGGGLPRLPGFGEEPAGAVADGAGSAPASQAPSPLPGLSPLGSTGGTPPPPPAGLPPLGVDPVLAAAHGAAASAAPSAPLPSLAGSVAPAGTAVAAAAMPLSASLLHSAGQPVAAAASGPIGGAAGLPSLGAAGGAGSGSGEVRRGGADEALADARKILADLAQAVADEETH